jgi:hypothetical protein
MIQSFGSSTGNLDFHSNTMYNISLGIGGGDGASGSVIAGPVNIYNNTIHDMENWDATGDANHHDGIYIWITNSSSSFTGTYNVYNNYIYNLGNYCSTAIYFDPGATSTYPNGTAFNNVINAPYDGTNGCGDGSFYDKSGKMRLYNNTIIAGNLTSVTGSATTILKNNISGAAEGMWFSTASISASDYNDWYGLGNPAMYYNSVNYSSLASFVSATSFDTHSITSNPNLNASHQLSAGSSAIGAGTNLYSTCNGQPNPGLGALCYDAAGNARPSSAAWDMGAYDYVSTTLAPATGVVAIPH